MAVRGGSQCGYCTPGLRLQHGRGVLPRRPRAGAPTAGTDRRRTSTAQRLRPARAERQPVPLHRLPPDPRRGLRARASRADDDPLADAAAPPRRRRRSPTRIDGRRDVRPAGRPRRGARAARRAPRRRSLVAGSHRLGRRGQPPRRAGAATSSRSTGCPSCASFDGRRRRRRDRRGAHPDRGRARARRPGPAARRGVPAVRVPADPQRRHHRRQPRHRLADRRPAAGAARARGRASSWPRADGDREVPLADYFTGYRADGPAARRADPRGADPAAARPGSPRSTRSPSAASTTSPASRSGSRSTSRDGVVRRGPDRARRRRRDPDPRAGDRGGARGPAVDRARRSREAAAVLRRRGHADGRPPGQRGVPLGDARHSRCSSCTPRRDRQEVPA